MSKDTTDTAREPEFLKEDAYERRMFDQELASLYILPPDAQAKPEASDRELLARMNAGRPAIEGDPSGALDAIAAARQSGARADKQEEVMTDALDKAIRAAKHAARNVKAPLENHFETMITDAIIAAIRSLVADLDAITLYINHVLGEAKDG